MYDKREFFIGREDYLSIEFQNQVPEVICDLLFALTGYVHHRTDSFTMESYKKMLLAQNKNTSIATKQQLDNYAEDGWKHSEEGIADNLEMLRKFNKNFKRERDAKATAEEDLKSKVSMIEHLKANKIPLSKEQKAIEKNFDKMLKAIIAKKESSMARSPSLRKKRTSSFRGGRSSTLSSASRRNTGALQH